LSRQEQDRVGEKDCAKRDGRDADQLNALLHLKVAGGVRLPMGPFSSQRRTDMLPTLLFDLNHMIDHP